MYLRISCYCDACLNSSDLRVGVTTLLNTIQYKLLKSCTLPLSQLESLTYDRSQRGRPPGQWHWRIH